MAVEKIQITCTNLYYRVANEVSSKNEKEDLLNEISGFVEVSFISGAGIVTITPTKEPTNPEFKLNTFYAKGPNWNNSPPNLYAVYSDKLEAWRIAMDHVGNDVRRLHVYDTNLSEVDYV